MDWGKFVLLVAGVATGELLPKPITYAAIDSWSPTYINFRDSIATYDLQKL